VRVHDFALDRARAGDHAAFADLTDPYRRELHLHCYRMLGSVTDAEDLLQETLTAAWRGLDGFAGDSSLRTWMYRIATHRCLNAIRDSKRRPPLEPAPPFTPPAPSRDLAAAIFRRLARRVTRPAPWAGGAPADARDRRAGIHRRPATAPAPSDGRGRAL
jgi:DNA-directed RNA polymerase specialized sigma24 family protein